MSRVKPPSQLGRIRSEETIKKMSLSHIGKYNGGFTGKKHTKETKIKMSESLRGNKSPHWRGGVSFLPYTIDWTRSLRISIRERDKYICQICGEIQGDYVHSVHHIDYNKLNCNPNNLITVCVRCHSKTNRNRDYWIKYFNSLKALS